MNKPFEYAKTFVAAKLSVQIKMNLLVISTAER